MRLSLFCHHSPALPSSTLLNERTFYKAFLRDLDNCQESLLIESPFITQARMNALYPSFRRLTKRGVRVVVNTRDPNEHDLSMRSQALVAVGHMQDLGITVWYTDYLHRKLAILDSTIMYEGSLNILSQNCSAEIMRRTNDQIMARATMKFLNIVF
ncbi:hypothetical protein IPG36_05245 [bacterium]|nr:MAG: hypothetical protein IPG36_05245 [bacterium]